MMAQPDTVARIANRVVWRTRNGVLLAAAMVTSAIAWWMIAWPVASLSNVDRHIGHFALTFTHMVGGTAMLLLGGINLYLAARKNAFPLHRIVGKLYLLVGGFGAILAMAITLSHAHKPADGPVLTNITVSLLTLASAWLACATLGWRAVLNRRFDSHAQWMVRSYVLAWSFVFCRIASRVTTIDDLGGGEAFIWLSWVGPLLVCEMMLQWPHGSKKVRPAAPDAARRYPKATA